MHEPRPGTDLWQYAAAAAVVGVLLVLAVFGAWPFEVSSGRLQEPRTLLEVLLHDRLTIGFIRAAVVAVAAYVVLSVPALIVDRRWMKGLGSAGLTTDDVRVSGRSIRELQEDLEALQQQLEFQLHKIRNVADIGSGRQGGHIGTRPAEGGAVEDTTTT